MWRATRETKQGVQGAGSRENQIHAALPAGLVGLVEVGAQQLCTEVASVGQRAAYPHPNLPDDKAQSRLIVCYSS